MSGAAEFKELGVTGLSSLLVEHHAVKTILITNHEHEATHAPRRRDLTKLRPLRVPHWCVHTSAPGPPGLLALSHVAWEPSDELDTATVELSVKGSALVQTITFSVMKWSNVIWETAVNGIGRDGLAVAVTLWLQRTNVFGYVETTVVKILSKLTSHVKMILLIQALSIQLAPSSLRLLL